MPRIRPDCRCISCTGSRQAASSTGSSASASRYPLITVNGERSSWDAFATKSLRIDSSRASPVTLRTISSCCALSLALTRWNSSQRSPSFGRWMRGGVVVPPRSR